MVVCQFHLRGHCRFGDSCRNEHPPQAAGSGSTSWDRPLASGISKTDPPYNAANISQDLNPKGEKPIWPLSSYAPFKNETTLIAGLDVSPEEMRVKAVVALNAGNVNEYIQYETNQIAAAEQVFTAARSNSNQLFEQALKQSRLVTTGAASTSAFPSTPPAFNNIAGPSTVSAFGNTTFGNDATPAFGTPALGPQANSTTSTFGKPAFGQPAFGQPAFGQPGFGQTSTLGPTPTSVFGQPTGGQPSSAFGGQQASTTTSTTTSAFGQSSFGQTNPLPGTGGSPSLIRPATGAFSAFAGSGPTVFGAGAAPTSSGVTGGTGGGFSAFAGQPTAFGSASVGGGNTPSVFGQPSSQATETTTAFGTPSTFGQQQPTGNAFSALTSHSNNTGSVFGSFGAPAPTTDATTATTAQPVSAFGGVQGQPSVFGNHNANSPQHPPVSAFAQLGPTTSNLTVSPSGLIPSISMASSNSGGSAFAASPMSTINPTAAVSKQPSTSSSSSNSIDFGSLITRTTYRPGSTPYDSQLPQNYSNILPGRVNNAFRKERFTWAWQDGEGAMPEWVPPVDVR